MMKKTVKAILVMVAIITVAFCMMISASAEESLPALEIIDTARVQTELYGDVNTPYFALENADTNALAFCVQSDKSHPETGSMYISSDYEASEEIKNNSAVWNVLINMSLEEPSDLLYKTAQQALWDAIDGTTSHRAIVLRRLGPDAVALYDKLMTEASWSYTVDFQFWSTATRANTQVLMSFKVIKLAEPTVETITKDIVETVEVYNYITEEKVVDIIEEVEVPNYIEVEVPYDVIVEIPIENIIEVEVPYDTIVEIPVENIIEVEIPYDTVVEVPVKNIVYEEKVIDVVETVEVYNYITEEKVIDIIEEVEVPNYIEVEVPYDTYVEIPVENIIEVEVPYDTIVEVPVENIVEVEVPYDTVVEVPVKNIVYEEKVIDVVETVEVYNYITEEKVIDIIEEVEVPNYIEVEVPYDVIVEVPVEEDSDEFLYEEYVPESIPQTGDNTNYFVAGIVGIIALIIFLLTIRKKEEEE